MPGMVPHTLLPSYGMGHGMERELSPHMRRSQSMPPGSYPPADPRWSPHAHAGRSDREQAARNAPPLLGWKTGRNDPTLMHNEVVKMRLGRDRSEMEPQQARPHAHPRPRPHPRPHPHQARELGWSGDMSFLGLNDDGTPMDDAEEGSLTRTPTLTLTLTPTLPLTLTLTLTLSRRARPSSRAAARPPCTASDRRSSRRARRRAPPLAAPVQRRGWCC